MRKIERTVAPSDNTRVAVRKDFVSIPLNQEQKQNLKIYGTLNKPETKQTELNQGRKLSPGEQVVRDKKLAKQSDLEEYQKRKEKEAKDLEQALVVAPYVIPGIGQAMWAGKAVDLAVSGASDGKYKSWGNMVDQKTGSGEFIGELTNPGYLIGGLSGVKSFKNNFTNNAKRAITNPTSGVIDVDLPKIDYKDLFKNSGFEIDDSMKEMMRRYSLKESKNNDVNNVLDNFYSRISTDEGISRAKNLGINPDKLSNRIKVKEDPFSYGYYSSGNIYMHPENTGNIARGTTRHELEHHVQNLSGGKPTIIDNDIKNLELRYNKKDVDWESRRNQFKKNVNIDNLRTSFNNDKQLATDYFLTGSDGMESSAMLSEVQQYMLDNGYIKHAYENITPEKVKEAFSAGYFDKENPVRIFKIIKASDKNYELISKNLNRMLTVAPIVGLYGLTQSKKQDGVPKHQEGGFFDKIVKSKEYNSPLATALKIVDPTGISSYGDVYNAWTDGKFLIK